MYKLQRLCRRRCGVRDLQPGLLAQYTRLTYTITSLEELISSNMDALHHAWQLSHVAVAQVPIPLMPQLRRRLGTHNHGTLSTIDHWRYIQPILLCGMECHVGHLDGACAITAELKDCSLPLRTTYRKKVPDCTRLIQHIMQHHHLPRGIVQHSTAIVCGLPHSTTTICHCHLMLQWPHVVHQLNVAAYVLRST